MTAQKCIQGLLVIILFTPLAVLSQSPQWWVIPPVPCGAEDTCPAGKKVFKTPHECRCIDEKDLGTASKVCKETHTCPAGEQGYYSGPTGGCICIAEGKFGAVE